jgi:tetratricopeptide (TPR) repeat protein
MKTELTGKRPHFRPERRTSNPYRVLLWLSLILGGGWLYYQIEFTQGVQPLFLPTATPTRTANSHVLEGQAAFDAGHLEDAIAAYQEALNKDPSQIKLWAELARIQTYSSSLLSTDPDRHKRLQEALFSIDQAVVQEPDDSNLLAIRSFVLNWYAFSRLNPRDERSSLLNEAEREASRAYTLDPNNAMALAYYAEVLVNQQKWSQADQYIKQAEELGKDSMDVQRVYGYVHESQGYYRAAIEKYREAAKINPNLTFLYIFIGRNFLALELHDQALSYFSDAVRINEQLGIQDPVPYIEIAKTYTRDGEFFIAALNAEKALRFNPYNPNTYGQLASIYTRARNYEGAQPAFKCAVKGCSAEENETAKQVYGQGVDVEGLPLSSLTVAYYYAQYGSVLAALSRPNQNYCPEALSVLEEVRRAYPEDEILLSIIRENENICQLVGRGSGS